MPNEKFVSLENLERYNADLKNSTKTINGQSIYGKGNLEIGGAPALNIFDVTLADIDHPESDSSINLRNCPIPTIVRVSDEVLQSVQSTSMTLSIPQGVHMLVLGDGEADIVINDKQICDTEYNSNFISFELRADYEKNGFFCGLYQGLIILSQWEA